MGSLDIPAEWDIQGKAGLVEIRSCNTGVLVALFLICVVYEVQIRPISSKEARDVK